MHAVLGNIVARSLPIRGLQEVYTIEKPDPDNIIKTYMMYSGTK